MKNIFLSQEGDLVKPYKDIERVGIVLKVSKTKKTVVVRWIDNGYLREYPWEHVYELKRGV